MKVDSIIFDLDGTLWNATKTTTEAWNEAFRQLGIEQKISTEQLRAVLGMQWEEIAEQFFSQYDEETREKIKNCCNEMELDYIRKHGAAPMPGMLPVIHALKQKYRLFIVSNCQKGYIETYLDLFDLWDDFEGFLCADETQLSKGENNKIIAEKYQLQSPVYVGDTNGDFESAKFAEIPFIYASYGFGEVKECTYKVRCLRELEQVLEGINEQEG